MSSNFTFTAQLNTQCFLSGTYRQKVGLAFHATLQAESGVNEPGCELMKGRVKTPLRSGPGERIQTEVHLRAECTGTQGRIGMLKGRENDYENQLNESKCTNGGSLVRTRFDRHELVLLPVMLASTESVSIKKINIT